MFGAGTPFPCLCDDPSEIGNRKNGNGGDSYEYPTGGIMRNSKFLPVALILAGLACAPGPSDVEIFEQEVRQAEIEFDRATAEGDVDRFADLVAEDAVFFGGTTYEGREAVVAAWQPFLDQNSGLSLRWSPSVVERGEYRLTQIAEDGSVSIGVGTFVTVWKRSDDGKWRAILDIGTPAQPAEAE
jgi:ketosteroid isomerase-like protein